MREREGEVKYFGVNFTKELVNKEEQGSGEEKNSAKIAWGPFSVLEWARERGTLKVNKHSWHWAEIFVVIGSPGGLWGSRW